MHYSVTDQADRTLVSFQGDLTVEAEVSADALGAVAVAMGAFNLLGGFAITHRMLRMFKQKGAPHE